ncbi:MAG: RNA-binding protein [Cyanobacteria bacterium SW_9_44_58]|nr:MAG: RNA-binding protein [Cyanobacteria bacterium SW_9_44_58]
MSVRLYVGNLPKEAVEREQLQEVFGEDSDSLSIKVIKDRKTGNCRGFAFVTAPNDEMADQIIEKYNGQTFKENALKIEKALPRNKNKGEGNNSNQEQESSSEGRSSRPNKQKNKDNAPSNKRRGKNNKKSKQPAASKSNNNTATQPDPRWADELAKLKEMLSSVEK